ncbi:hypothetical protein BD560DRAFT_394185 [Blakeslea trispora]|nr:hypothetical protein BD560DRAFT_394185 [Blakeslea trispora]
MLKVFPPPSLPLLLLISFSPTIISFFFRDHFLFFVFILMPTTMKDLSLNVLVAFSYRAIFLFCLHGVRLLLEYSQVKKNPFFFVFKNEIKIKKSSWEI